MASSVASSTDGALERIAVFGGVRAWRDGVEIALGGAKPRAALAALVLAGPHPVDRSTLIDVVWGADLPADPDRDLRRIVHGLRAALGHRTIATHPAGGYRSTIPRSSLDVTQLEHALSLARNQDMDRTRILDALQRAIDETTGEALGGLALGSPALSGLARALSELRLAAQDTRAELLLMSGLAPVAVSLLEELVSATPLHEERWALLMTALAVSGRRSEALRCYQRARIALIDVGVEPGARLQSLEAALLNGDLPAMAPVHSRNATHARRMASMPPTRYVEVDGSCVAYQVWGSGPVDIVLIPQIVSHLEAMLDLPGYRSWIEGLASVGRVAVFDKRGNGLSDRLVCSLSVEDRVADITAVMDAVGMQRAALVGTSEGGTLALRYAGLQPDRVHCVVAAGATAAGRLAAGLMTEEVHNATIARVRDTWGTGQDWWMYELAAPSLSDAPQALRRRYEQMNRMSCTPTVAAFLWDLYGRMDIRDALRDVRCPVLVQHRDGESLAWAAPDLVARLANAEQSVVPGNDHPVWVGDVGAYLEPIRSFIERHAPTRCADPNTPN